MKDTGGRPNSPVSALGLAARRFQTLPLERQRALTDLVAALDLQTKFKLTVSFYQVVSRISTICKITMPSEVSALLSSFTIAVTLGFDLTLPFECAGAFSYEERLIFWIFFPMGLVVLVAIFAVMKRIWERLEMSQKLSYKKISMGILLIQESQNFIQQKLEFNKVYGASGYKPQEHIPMVLVVEL